MDRDGPIYEAYDGVELRLLNGRVAKCSALTVREAVHFTRAPVAVDEDGTATEAGMLAIAHHFAAFCERIGLIDVPLADIALDGVDDIEFGHLAVRQALQIAHHQSLASDLPNTVAGAESVAWLLDEIPAEFGLADPPVAEVFMLARRIRVALYRHLDWLLRRFFTVLATSPGVRTLEMKRAPRAPIPPGASPSRASVT